MIGKLYGAMKGSSILCDERGDISSVTGTYNAKYTFEDIGLRLVKRTVLTLGSLRGGSWFHVHLLANTVFRNDSRTETCDKTVGFRLIRRPK